MIETIVPSVLLVTMVAILLIQARQLRELNTRIEVQKEISVALIAKLMPQDEGLELLQTVRKMYS